MQAGSDRRASAAGHSIRRRHRYGRTTANAARASQQAARAPSQPLLRPLALSLLLALSGPALAADYYWINSFGGTWDEQFNYGGGVIGTSWKDAAGNFGIPGAGDNAYLVLPYQLTVCPGGTCITQPVPVTYRSNTNPVLNRVVINSDNYLTQPAFGEATQLHLTSNHEVIGSGETFTPPSGVFYPNPPGIYPRGQHIQSRGTNTVNTELILGNIVGGEGTYTFSGGSLSVGTLESIGKSGTGIFKQSGGTHFVGTPSNLGSLILGNTFTGTGTYSLDEGELTVKGSEIIGSAGTGTFSQSRWTGSTTTNTTNALILGQEALGVGTYNLNRDGTLQADEEIIGWNGKGTFIQKSPSKNTTRSLVLAAGAGSVGTYEMDGNLTVAYRAEIGRNGQALFTQQNGSIKVNEGGDADGGMWIGGSTGTVFKILDGRLNVYGTEKIEKGGLLQFDGYHEVHDTATSTGKLIVDWDGQGYILVNGELRTTNLLVGDTGKGKFSQGGGTAKISGGLYLGQSAGSFGTIDQTNGNLTTSVAQVGGLGAGRLILSNGEHRVEYNLLVGGHLNSDFSITTGAGGIVSMSNGTLTVGKEILHNTTYAFADGLYEGAFSQSGGTHIVQNMLKIESQAKYELINGSLSAGSEELNGIFTHTGGTHTVAGDMTMTGDRSGAVYTLGAGQQLKVGNLYNNWGFIEFGDGSSIEAGGGVVQNSSPDRYFSYIRSQTGSGAIAGATVKNYSLIEVTGGDAELTSFVVGRGDVWNYKDATIRIGRHLQYNLTGFDIYGDLHNSNGGQIIVDYGRMIVHGNIANSGVINIEEGKLSFYGTLSIKTGGVVYASYSELGGGDLSLDGGARLFTDPSTLRVNNLTVDETSYISATAGDRFFIGGDFTNRSQNGAAWDTAEATLLFDGEGAVRHVFYLPGMDRGASESGFVDNFAWGVLGLAADDSLMLLDGNNTPGAALYVGVIAEGTDLDSISSPYNIYYDPALAGNAWLAGARMALDGGGFLAPVPEPRSALLLSLGVLMLAGLRRRWRSH